jgi:N-acetylneuraminate synthase
MDKIKIGNRWVGRDYFPLVIADIGINHFGSLDKAVRMVYAAAEAGCECVKFQCHIPEAEMLKKAAKEIVPVNADESIYDIMEKCSLTEEQEKNLKTLVESLGMIYLNTPFSREAVDRLERIGVVAYKIGSGEMNNLPLVEYIASKKKPIIMSTGMNDFQSVSRSVEILQKYGCDFALLQCTSLYPTSHEKVKLKSMVALKDYFCCPVGLSDHTLDFYSCLGAVSLGASILEKHFVDTKIFPGPDVAISMDPSDLAHLVMGSVAVWKASRGDFTKQVVPGEEVTINFAYASVVTIKDIKKGELFTEDNIWLKRPNSGEIKAEDFKYLLGKKATCDLKQDEFLRWIDVVV